MAFIRKTNRLPHKPLYQSNNWYFVTICTSNKTCIFNTVAATSVSPNHNVSPNQNVMLPYVNPPTQVIINWFQNIHQNYQNVSIDDWVIMPNHIHCVIEFEGTPHSNHTQKLVSLGDIIKSFKIYTQSRFVRFDQQSSHDEMFICGDTHGYNSETLGNDGDRGVAATEHVFPDGFNYHKFWQKSYYDHIIRNDKDLNNTRTYIINNPTQWELDELHPINIDKNG